MAKRKTIKELLTENLGLQSDIEHLRESFETEKKNLNNSFIEERENIKNVWQEKYDNKIVELQEKINSIGDEKRKLNLQWKEKLDGQIKEYEEKFSALEREKDFKILDLEEGKRELQEECLSKQKQIDFHETKKLAKAYEDQKNEYKRNSDIWFNHLTLMISILGLSTFSSFVFARRVVWYERFEYYFIDVILISSVWFCAKQYSYYIQLYSDFANRQALAQSIHNILNNAEDALLKEKFIEKSMEILCMKNNVQHKENLPVEKILNTTVESLNVISKKLK